MKKIINLSILIFLTLNISSSNLFSQQNNAMIKKHNGGNADVLTTLFLTCFLQGYYNFSTDLMVAPVPVIVTLHGAAVPYPVIAAAPVILGTDGFAAVKFPIFAGPGPFFVSVESSNMIETWSSALVPFPAGLGVYDFSPAAGATFGGNAIEIDTAPITFGSYVGDVNQDGVIDVTDLALIDNDAYNFVSGPVPTDLNGDLIVDVSDAALADNNAFNFVSVIRP